LTLFGDLECPICRLFVLAAGFPKLVARDVRAGQVQVVYRGFRTASHSTAAFEFQQVAALAAGEQHRFWQFATLFLHAQGTEGTPYITEQFLDAIANQIPGLNIARWRNARHDLRLLHRVRSDERLANREGITGTPTLIFKGPHGKAEPSSPVPSYSELERTITSVK
jgi:protein-disulfide isomerase